MPRRDDDPANKLLRNSERLLADSRQLREVSRQLLGYMADLHELELRSRTVPMGSPEFVELSAEVTALSREVFSLSVEQEAAGKGMPEQSTTLEEMDSIERDDPRSPSV